MGIVIGIITIVIALVFNYINLYTMYDRKEKAKHWVISYYLGWVIAIIPIYGIIHQFIWFLAQLGPCDYECKSVFFKNV